MGNNSPGKMRRQGGEAFVEGHDPEVECPAYLSKMHNSYQKQSWMEGWHEAEKEYEDEQQEDREEIFLHSEIMLEIEGIDKTPHSVSNLVMLLIRRGILT